MALPEDEDEELDAEGMDLVDGYLWVVGSHSRTRDRLKPGDGVGKTLPAFAKVHKRPNRKVLLRVALETDGGAASQEDHRSRDAAHDRGTDR